MKKLLVLTTLLAFSVELFAGSPGRSCNVNGPSVYNYSASIDKQTSYLYGDGDNISEKHRLGIYVNDCQKAAGKFLMVGFGVNNFSVDASTVATVYSNELAPNKCVIKNSTLKNFMDDAERARIHKNKAKFLELCVETTITQNSSMPLKYRAQQLGCQVQKVSAQRAIIRPTILTQEDGTTEKTNFCFFKVYKDSEFVIAHEIKEECTNPNFLKENGLEPMEVNAATTFSIADKPTGKSQGLEILPSRVTNFTVEPSSSQTELTDDFGKDIPQYPSSFRLPELEFGKLTITNTKHGSNFKFPLHVDNRCEKRCENGLCTSPCNYSQPIAGEVTLFEVSKGKKEYLRSWYDGAVAPANWQGLLDMPTRELKGIFFEDGKRYELEVTFRDPKTDFTMFNKSITPLFQPLPGVPTVNFATSVMSGIPTVAGIQNIEGVNTVLVIPDYGSVKDLGNFLDHSGLQGVDKLSKFNFWPPYYEDNCGPKGCKKIGSKPYMTARLGFTAKVNQANNKVEINDVNFSKRSTLFGNFDKKLSKMPQIVCPWDLGE